MQEVSEPTYQEVKSNIAENDEASSHFDEIRNYAFERFKEHNYNATMIRNKYLFMLVRHREVAKANKNIHEYAKKLQEETFLFCTHKYNSLNYSNGRV